jgi:hypothetical protein
MKKPTYRHRNARWLVMFAPLLLAAACSGVATDSSSTSTGASSPTQEATPTQASSTDPGVTSIDASVIGGGTYPSYTVKAPPPWSTPDGHFVMDHTGGVVLGLSVWDVGLVAGNPCHSVGHLYDPGPTVTDLVAALAAQPMRHASTPTDVTLGGYRARYLEWSVPAHMAVNGDSDFAGCDVQGNGHRDFVSWDGNGLGERYEQVAGQVDRLWILNVHGQRLLVDSTYSPDATQAQRHELGQIAKSLRFVAPAA